MALVPHLGLTLYHSFGGFYFWDHRRIIHPDFIHALIDSAAFMHDYEEAN